MTDRPTTDPMCTCGHGAASAHDIDNSVPAFTACVVSGCACKAFAEAADTQAARFQRREPLLVLLSRMQRGVLLPQERDLLRAAVDTELRDGDQAHEQLAGKDGRGRTASDVLVEHDVTRKALCDALDVGYHLNWQQITDTAQRSHAANAEWQREAEERRTKLATTLKRGPGADWHAVHAAAAEYVGRAERAEAARDRDRRHLAEARRLRDEACGQLDARQLAMAKALGLGNGATWDVLHERAETAVAAAYERADLLETARDALSTAGQNGPHGDNWPAIAPGIEALAAERDEARHALKLWNRAAEQERERADQAEAAITRVRAQAADWAQLASPGDVGMTPSDTAFAEAGRILLAALDGEQPATEPEPDAVHTHLTDPQPILIRIDLVNVDKALREAVRRTFRHPPGDQR